MEHLQFEFQKPLLIVTELQEETEWIIEIIFLSQHNTRHKTHDYRILFGRHDYLWWFEDDLNSDWQMGIINGLLKLILFLALISAVNLQQTAA